ncbi:MAG: hypothetical protein ABI557_18145, partial [Aureliella sp.]
LLAVSYLSIVLIAPHAPPQPTVNLFGYWFGSLYAHASLAAVWAALGPGTLKYRALLSFVWVLALPTGLLPSAGIGGPPIKLVAMFGCSLFGHWLLLRIVLAGLAWHFDLRIGHSSDVIGAAGKNRSQFMMRDLMLLITASACVFAIARLLLPILLTVADALTFFIFLSLAAIILNLPLAMAALVKRFVVISVLTSTAFLAVATYFELSVIRALGVSGPTDIHLITINASSSALILVVAVAVRVNGFRLFVRWKLIKPSVPS